MGGENEGEGGEMGTGRAGKSGKGLVEEDAEESRRKMREIKVRQKGETGEKK